MTRARRLAAIAGVLLLTILALPWSRQAMEASMWRHMLLQYPLWIAGGALVTGVIPPALDRRIARWNVGGASGLILAVIVLGVLMIPRVLDLALVQPRIEAAKLGALFFVGVALRLSWRRASVVLQFFALGNILSMMAIAGMLYMSSPLRLCNAYLLDDQERLGLWLTTLAAVLGVAWLAWIIGMLMRREAAYYDRIGHEQNAAERCRAGSNHLKANAGDVPTPAAGNAPPRQSRHRVRHASHTAAGA